MRITALVENTSKDNRMAAEHGLSLYIETREHKILFDMGQSGLFAENAEKLGIDLSGVTLAVLSHGHYDHGGGMKRFLELNQDAPVYLSRYAFEPHYNAEKKYIGLDTSLAGNKRLKPVEDVESLGDGLTLYSCNDRERMHPVGSSGLYMLRDGVCVPDDFRHEQYLLIEEEKRVLISGCSHKGILDIAGWFKPDVLIGGFHFSKLPTDGVLTGYAEFLNRFATGYYTCHCTGVAQYEHMKQSMEHLHYLSCGETIII